MKKSLMYAGFLGFTLSLVANASVRVDCELGERRVVLARHFPQFYSLYLIDGDAIQDISEVFGVDESDVAVLKIPGGESCQTSRSTVGIETVTCRIQDGAELRMVGAKSPSIPLSGGTLVFHRNIFYAGTAKFLMELVSKNEEKLSLDLDFSPAESCSVEG